MITKIVNLPIEVPLGIYCWYCPTEERCENLSSDSKDVYYCELGLDNGEGLSEAEKGILKSEQCLKLKLSED